MPRRENRPGRTSETRKARALRPMLDRCEPRTMLSGATTGIVIEPLLFSANAVSRGGQSVEVAGTLRLTEGSGGRLAGNLIQADGTTLTVRGTLRGEHIDLSIRNPTGPLIHAVGPVVSATTTTSQLTLHGGGLLLGAGHHSQGTFRLRGSEVVLPAGHLQNPGKVVRVIPPGTTLVPTGFVGKVTHGPDANMTLSGVLSLGKVGGNGSFAGSLADPVHGTIPVSGRIVGGRIKLAFDLGPGNAFGGVGPFEAQQVGKGQVELLSFGSLQTENSADSGDWFIAGGGGHSVRFVVASETINAATGAFSIKVELEPISTVGRVPFTLGGTAMAGVDYANVKARVPGNANTVAFDLEDGNTQTITGTLIRHPGAPARTLTFTLLKPPGSAYIIINGVNTLTNTE